MNPHQTPANHRKANRLQETGGVDQSAPGPPVSTTLIVRSAYGSG